MTTTLDLAVVLEQDAFTADSYRSIKELAFASAEALNRFREILAAIERKAAAGEGDVPRQALKLGLSYLLLGDPAAAAQWLEKSEDGALRTFYLGHALREMKRFDDAIVQFDKAAQCGWDALQCTCQRAETLITMGRFTDAISLLEAVGEAGKDAAEWHYVRARLHQDLGEIDQAIGHYEEVLKRDPQHTHAMFHLAYVLDLHGSDERALELYTVCAKQPFVHSHALVNLAVNYEDRGEYVKAAQCLRRVLRVTPNDRRAQLYLKDVLASCEMYIDEEEIIEEETRGAVLDIPVTDFELSVRSRNCLKKMNINTLGDLLRITEEELLSYKNFGETSLKEIKAMLTQKGLGLGQYAHQKAPAPPAAVAPPALEGNPEILAKSVSALQLSVRSRKCLQRLGVNSVGDLTIRSESELLSSRNFGQTSLNEIKTRLAELGLALRGSK